MADPEVPSNRRLVLYFVLLGALLPEAITGSTSPLMWLNPVSALLNLWLYGTGVLLVRELSIRWHVGWPGILVLGAAYGIVEEGLAVTTFFNPLLPQLGALGVFGRWIGVNWVWSAWLAIFHGTVSIGFTIFLIEWHYPAIRGRSLLGPRALILDLVLLGLATLVINALVYSVPTYRPGEAGAAQYLGALAAIALIVVAARWWAVPLWNRFPARRLRSPRRYAVLGFGFLGGSFFLYSAGQGLGDNPVLTLAEGAAVLVLTLWLIRGISGRPEAERDRFAFVFGGIAFFVLFDVLLAAAGKWDMIVSAAAFSWYAAWLYREKGPVSAKPVVRLSLG